MPNRIDLPAVAVAMAAVAVSLTSAAPAHAADQRPCVSRHEFNSTDPGLTRAQIESRWDVRGDAIKRPSVYADGLLDGEFGRIYAACGYETNEAWVTVFFDRKSRVVHGTYRTVLPGATLSGRP